MHYPCCENKSADQLRGYSASLFSHMQIVGFPMGRLKCLTYLVLYTSLQDCFDLLLKYHEIGSLFAYI